MNFTGNQGSHLGLPPSDYMVLSRRAMDLTDVMVALLWLLTENRLLKKQAQVWGQRETGGWHGN